MRHGGVEDGLGQDALDLHAEGASARAALLGAARDRLERPAREAQPGRVRLEEGRVLLDEGVAGLGEHAQEVLVRERGQRRDVVDPPDELRDEAERLEVRGRGEVEEGVGGVVVMVIAGFVGGCGTVGGGCRRGRRRRIGIYTRCGDGGIRVWEGSGRSVGEVRE